MKALAFLTDIDLHLRDKVQSVVYIVRCNFVHSMHEHIFQDNRTALDVMHDSACIALLRQAVFEELMRMGNREVGGPPAVDELEDDEISELDDVQTVAMY